MAEWPKGIRPRGNGFQIRIWKHGKLAHTETVPGTGKSALAHAVKRREQLEARKLAGMPLVEHQPGGQSFISMATGYLESLDIDVQTIREYYNQINARWVPVFGNWPIHDVTTRHIKDALAHMDVSQKTKKNLLIPLSGIFSYAGIVPNPAAGVSFGKRQKAPVERYTPEERDKVLARLEGTAKVYFALLFATGLRPGEACALTWADWDGEQLYIGKQITKGKHKARTKTYVARKVYVPQWVRPILLNHVTRFEGGYIFVNTQGNPYLNTRYLNKAWKKAHQRARVRLRTPYVCRHTRAAELLSMGVTPADAASQLGHGVQVFLNTYSEFMVEYAERQDFSRFEPNTAPALATISANSGISE